MPNGVLNASSNVGSSAAAALANNQSLREWALTLLGKIIFCFQNNINNNNNNNNTCIFLF